MGAVTAAVYQHKTNLDAVVSFFISKVTGTHGNDEEEEKEDQPQVEAARRRTRFCGYTALVGQMGSVVVLVPMKDGFSRVNVKKSAKKKKEKKIAHTTIYLALRQA